MNGTHWNDVEQENLKRMYTAEFKGQPKFTIEELEDLFLRSEDAIRCKASELGLKRPELMAGIDLDS